MNGTRCYDKELHELAAGEYQLLDNGELWFCDPTGIFAHISPTIHKITVHDDATITVSPSILNHAGHNKEWHGYLEHGIWRTV